MFYLKLREGITMTTVNYEQDIVAWANEQAWLIRHKKFELLDIEHLAEEIEDVGKSEQRELANRMAVLLCHLLKWQYQPARQGASWQATIKTQRERIKRRLNKTPSLNHCLKDSEWWADAWDDARDATTKETGVSYEKFPEKCPWLVEDILSDNWVPRLFENH
ncbi:MAG: DUF29 domain-containing protein [Methylovulum sp.]|nr:DUF29 domain-containing protein [Methylovulum sp.]